MGHEPAKCGIEKRRSTLLSSVFSLCLEGNKKESTICPVEGKYPSCIYFFIKPVVSYDLDNVVSLKLNANSAVMVPVVSRCTLGSTTPGVYTNLSYHSFLAV